ncbi:MAG: Dabb family protein [Phycisphaerales bacterium]
MVPERERGWVRGRRRAPVACAAAAAALLAGCAATPEQVSLSRKAKLDTAPITHVVLIQLKDPTRAAELVADCDRALPALESVASYSCGVPLATDRTTVLRDYDVGIYVGFRNGADYRAYVDDPRHLALVERWRDGWKAVRIWDIAEGTTGAVAGDPLPTPAPEPETTPAEPVAPAPAATPKAAPADAAAPANAPAAAPTKPPAAAPAPAEPKG